jgi:hypothetical protein
MQVNFKDDLLLAKDRNGLTAMDVAAYRDKMFLKILLSVIIDKEIDDNKKPASGQSVRRRTSTMKSNTRGYKKNIKTLL